MRTAHDWCILQETRGTSNFNIPLIVQELPITSPYANPGVLYWNGAGKGVLRQVQIRTGQVWNNQELIDYLVTLHDVPLVFWQDSGCSTCTKLIQAGCEGNEDVADQVQLVESLTIGVLQQSASFWIDRLLPILELLPVGFYYITLLDYYPTDGHGNFFWDAFHTLRCWNPFSWDSIEDIQHIAIPKRCDEEPALIPSNPPPCYLVPSQHPSCFSSDSLTLAKDRYAAHPGLVLRLKDTASLVLDGHHRATAAALAGKTFSCLTIEQLSESFISPWLFITHFQKALNIPTQLMDWSKLRKECIQQTNLHHWHEAMIEHFSKFNYPFKLPAELNLAHSVSHYPMHYRLNEEELVSRFQHFQRALLPVHIKYEDGKTIQGM